MKVPNMIPAWPASLDTSLLLVQLVIQQKELVKSQFLFVYLFIYFDR